MITANEARSMEGQFSYPNLEMEIDAIVSASTRLGLSNAFIDVPYEDIEYWTDALTDNGFEIWSDDDGLVEIYW